MQVAKLNLEDLVPSPSTFELSSFPGRKLQLGAFTLRAELWVKKTYGSKGLETAIGTQDLALLLPIAFYLLSPEDKKAISSEDLLAEATVTFKDRAALAKAVMESFGLSQPVLEDLERQIKAQEKKDSGESPAEPIGGNSTTNAPTPTAGP